MADISKIRVNNADYTIKDQTARNHIANTSNPHSVTKAQVGLGNVENKSSATIRGEITSSNVTTALGYTPVSSAKLGAANGVATLDSTGKVPATQLPSYVDDVVEGYYHDDDFYTTRTGSGTSADPYAYSGEITGETGKIYVDLNTNKTYRWGGTAFAEISASLALGETSSTAYRGDRGKTAYNHATDSNRLTTAKSEGLYKVAVTAEGHVKSVTAVAKADITALGIPASNTTYSAGTGLSLSGTTFNHSNSITAQTSTPADDNQDRSRVAFPTITVDGTGHVSAVGTKKVKIELEHVTSSGDIDGTYATVTPSGTVSQPTFSGTQQTVNLSLTKTNGTRAFLTAAVDQAGVLPSMSVSNETLIFSPGSFPTYETEDALADVSGSVTFTPGGTVSQPTFTGNTRYVVGKLRTVAS